MKILVYGLPRTRSSYLLDVLCQHYNLKNYFEPYGGILLKSIKDKIPKHKYPTLLWSEFKTKTKEVTVKLTTQDDFGCKIFAGNLFDWIKYTPNQMNPIPNYTGFTKDEFICAYEYYNIDMYDKIYFTYRNNEADQFCSFEHADQHNNFMFFKGQEKLAKLFSPKHKTIKYNYVNIKFWIFQSVVYNWFSEKLLKTKTNIIKLEYNEIPNYLQIKYPNITSRWVENCYDYSKTINNYKQIFDDCQKAKEELHQEGVYEYLDLLSK